jgi:hypothetical protein
MSLEGNICYLIVYNYESNVILGLPISGFDDSTIFTAYKTQFEFLESKGFKIKLNVMDNQCTKQIKKFLTDKDCELMLVEPHNHRVNAAEHAIQTFKDHFISALTTTDSELPLQLWDKLTSQVETTLNLMQASRINPNISAYEAIWGPYDWNCFPLAPPGCKASSTNLLPHENLGEAVEWMGGTSAHRSIITNATITSSPRHKHIESQDRQSYSPSIARSHSCQQMTICTN